MAEQSIDIHLVQFYCGMNEYRLSSKVTVHILSNGDPGDYRDQTVYDKLSRLRTAIRNIEPDAIIAFLGTVGTKALLASRGLGIPVFTTIRNNPRYSPPGRLERWLRNASILLSRGCLVQTETQAIYFPIWIRWNLKVLPNPVPGELESIHKSYHHTCQVIVAAGRLVKQKNFALLIRSFVAVHERYPCSQLHIYGEGELRPILTALIHRLGLTSSVLLKGTSNDLWQELSRADLFVLSSEAEGMPNVLMEAMALGLPCISTDCPTGPAELIDNYWNGILVPNGDQAELAKAIIYMVQNPVLGHEMGRRARQQVLERYNLSRNVTELVDYLDSSM